MSTVDIVVPCYNYGRYLRACIESLLCQEGVDVRVLIIDDGSTDETPRVGADLARSDSRVEYRRHAANVGHIETYNEGLLGWARADYSVLLSADDLLTPGSLARAAGLMDQRPEVGLVCGTAVVFWGDALPRLGDPPPETRVMQGKRFLERCFRNGNPVATPTAVVRTRLQQEIGGYDPSLPHTADMEMWMRFGVHADVGVIKAPQAFYRRHTSNMSRQYTEHRNVDRQEVLRACERIVERWGERVPESREWLGDLRRRLARESVWAASSAFDDGHDDWVASWLEFSRRADPRITRSALWWRLAAKRALGRDRVLRLRRRLRGEASPPPSTDRLNAPYEHGWWPDSGG